jgi:hypothetical protein
LARQQDAATDPPRLFGLVRGRRCKLARLSLAGRFTQLSQSSIVWADSFPMITAAAVTKLIDPEGATLLLMSGEVLVSPWRRQISALIPSAALVGVTRVSNQEHPRSNQMANWSTGILNGDAPRPPHRAIFAKRTPDGVAATLAQ